MLSFELISLKPYSGHTFGITQRVVRLDFIVNLENSQKSEMQQIEALLLKIMPNFSIKKRICREQAEKFDICCGWCYRRIIWWNSLLCSCNHGH